MNSKTHHANSGEREWASRRLNEWRSERNAEALGELLKWQRDRAYATAYRILSKAEDAEDAVQQAFVKMLSRTHGFESEDAFRMAVYRAVVQCSLDLARSRQIRSVRENIMSNMETPTTSSAQDAAQKEEQAKLVLEEIAHLPEEDRVAVVLCCQEGLSVSAAAEVLELKRETLRDRLGCSLKSLRKRLRRRGVALSMVGVASLLLEQSAQAAPAGLCHVLDKALPGATCANVAVAGAVKMAPAALVASAGITTSIITAKVAAVSAAAVLSISAVTATVYSNFTHVEQSPIVAAPEKEEKMKKKLAALVLSAAVVSGSMVAPASVQAGEGETDAVKLAQIVKEIKAHRAGKAAESKAAAKSAKAKYNYGGGAISKQMYMH